MALIKTLQEAKKYVRINYANSDSSLPNFDLTERKFILPVLGEELYEEVVTKYNGNDQGEPFRALLARVQAALAPLGYWMDLPLINTQITDMGLMKSASAEKQPVFKHDFYKVLSALLQQGMDAIEYLLAYLDNNQDAWPTWTTGTGYVDYTRFLIRTGQEFSSIFTLKHPRRCFLALCPTIQLVEDKYLSAGIGGAFFLEIKNKPNPTDQEKVVLTLLKKAEAYLAIHHAVSLLSVSLTDAGFTIQVSDPDLPDTSREASDQPGLRKLEGEAEKVGNSYLTDAITYLNANASATVFPTYFSSALYRDPNIQRPSLNSQLQSTFTL